MSGTKVRNSWSGCTPATSIIIPVLHEADNILPLVKRISQAVARRMVEVLFVDDSHDTKTVAKVKQAGASYSTRTFAVSVYRRTGKKRRGGLSGAVSDGIARAKSDRIIVMDGDLQHPPEIMVDMIKASRGSDIVIASRYRDGGSAKGLGSIGRHIISRGSTFFTKAFFPFRMRSVSDPMTGYFLIKRTKINTQKLQPQGFKILLEILATHPKLTVAEIPLQFTERKAGKSHGTLKQGLEFAGQLINLRLGREGWIRSVKSLPKPVLFGAVGGSVFVLGMVLLYFMVESLGWSPLLANAIQLAVTFWLNYLLNRKLTWHERSVSHLAAHKFIVSRAATTVLNYLMFFWLIMQQYSFTAFGHSVEFSINYLMANIITLTIIMTMNYIISDRWAFAETKEYLATPRLPYCFRSSIPTLPYLTALLFIVVIFGLAFDTNLTISIILTIASLGLFVQASIEVWRMIYVFREPDGIDRMRFPVARKAKESFCIIVPARHESAVLAGTLRQLARQTHPDVHIISVICDDDIETLRTAFDVAHEEPRIEVMSYPLQATVNPSKPKQLNYVFNQIKDKDYTIIGVVDAEDTVHEELLMRVEAAFRDHKTGIVQGGVQLMNHDTSWYSLHNVLEYYRWFNSTMAFQADSEFMPLGGNTIFVREKLLRQVDGWPDTLTEDCSLGVLLSTRYKTKTAVYYEPRLATREETPDSLMGLFRQRVRWNQGFFHEWRKGVWRELPSFRQRLLADYTLFNPVLLSGISLLLPISLLAMLMLNAPVGVVMIMYLSLVPTAMNVVLNAVLLRDFGKAFERKIRLRHYALLFATQIFYQILLNTAAFWAVVRELRGEYSWHKTTHSGKHRPEPTYAVAMMPDNNFEEEDGNA